MKILLVAALSIIFFKTNVQGQVIGGQDVVVIPDDYQLREAKVKAARTFENLILNNSRNYIGATKKVLMLQGGKVLDTLRLDNDNYIGGGTEVPLNLFKPAYYEQVSKAMCTSNKPADKKGCEINVKKLCYLLRDKFYYFRFNNLKRSGDTLVVAVNYSGMNFITKFKFNKKGLIESSESFDFGDGDVKKKGTRTDYVYDKNDNLIKESTLRYKDYSSDNPTIKDEYNEIEFTADGNISKNTNSRYTYNKDVPAKTYINQILYFYDNLYNLIKKQMIFNGELAITDDLVYDNGSINVTETNRTLKTKPLFSYKLLK